MGFVIAFALLTVAVGVLLTVAGRNPAFVTGASRTIRLPVRALVRLSHDPAPSIRSSTPQRPAPAASESVRPALFAVPAADLADRQADPALIDRTAS